MEIVDTMTKTALAVRPLRRQYSLQFKTQVVHQCREAGASLAGVALSHGINANIVHRWLRELGTGALVAQTSNEFVPVKLAPPPGAVEHTDAAPAPQIRVEVRRGNSAVVVNWPLLGASSCAAWLRDWLK